VGISVSRAEAEQYAGWFRALSDATRAQIVSVLAQRGQPMKVGEIVAAVHVSQSTVSQHLKVLGRVRFVLSESRGTARHYRLNQACVDSFPHAADLIVGRRPPRPPVPGPVIAGPPGRAGITVPATQAAGVSVPARRPVGASIRAMRPADAGRVLAIYQAGLDVGDASFETEAPSWAAFDASKLPGHRHVAIAEDSGEVLGWVAATAVSDRCAYAGVVEHSVYVDPAARGRGAGAALLRALIGSTEAAGIWTIQSGIFPENTISIRLHERAGFHVVGTRERIGRHHGRWRDVVLIERRSAIAGTG
jgi:L-amino acid N-acyltransferase YncA/DNA-binding transcriptional ArsR family regulator